MRVSVFGLGYVGSVSAACLARAGHRVIGVDTNAARVRALDTGRAPLVEPGLDELVARVVSEGNLRATVSAEEALAEAELALVCVGTPGRANGQLDVSALERVSHEIGRVAAERGAAPLVVIRSTVLPGTTERVVMPALLAAGARPGQLRVAVNPEFMREGSSLVDFAAPPMTLVGCEEAASGALLKRLYAGVQAPFVRTSRRVAETVKYVANAFHALKVCFANEVGDACEALAVDAQEVMRIFRLDHKLNVSEAYLRPGFAFGGSCLPKDLRALLHAAHAADAPVPLLSTILPSNEAQLRRGIAAVLAERKRRVGVVGLSFKDRTDDLRESPMVLLVEGLIGKGLDVRVLDANVSLARLVGANRRYIEEEIPHISRLLCTDADALLAHAEVLVIGTSSAEAEAVLARARPDQAVVDLTRAAASTRRADRPELVA